MLWKAPEQELFLCHHPSSVELLVEKMPRALFSVVSLWLAGAVQVALV